MFPRSVRISALGYKLLKYDYLRIDHGRTYGMKMAEGTSVASLSAHAEFPA